MPHERDRILKEWFLKRMKLWPVVGLLGARQTGKSTFLREAIAKEVSGRYRTLDVNQERSRASAAPDSFAEDGLATRQTLIIDEVQKAPSLFDSVKAVVDRARRPGIFVLSGSSEFSEQSGVRESLTGRIGLMYLYPMTVAEIFRVKSGRHWSETLPKPQRAVIGIDDLRTALDQGGMPGICFLRSELERQSAFQQWLETTCYRDLPRMKSMKRDFDPDLALAILSELARSPEGTPLQVAKKVRRDRRVVQRYLDGFCAIFVLHRLNPHAAGVGDPCYVLLDPGLAGYLEASVETQLRCFLLKEGLAHFSAAGFPKPRLEYYRNARTSRVPILFSWPKAKGSPPRNFAIHFNPSESYPRAELAALRAFLKRAPEQGFQPRIFNFASAGDRVEGVELIPFRA